MKDEPVTHRRRSTRVQGYDYTGRGGYFVTIGTHGHACLFGGVASGSMRLNALGEIVKEEWFKTAEARPNIFLDANEFVVMPNHLHGIIWIMQTALANDAARIHPRSQGLQPGALGAIIGQFKSVTTKRINAHRGSPGRVSLATELLRTCHPPRRIARSNSPIYPSESRRLGIRQRKPEAHPAPF